MYQPVEAWYVVFNRSVITISGMREHLVFIRSFRKTVTLQSKGTLFSISQFKHILCRLWYILSDICFKSFTQV